MGAVCNGATSRYVKAEGGQNTVSVEVPAHCAV